MQDDTSTRRMVDSKFQMLLLAFATAPALVELHVQLPDQLAIASQSLVGIACHGATLPARCPAMAWNSRPAGVCIKSMSCAYNRWKLAHLCFWAAAGPCEATAQPYQIAHTWCQPASVDQ